MATGGEVRTKARVFAIVYRKANKCFKEQQVTENWDSKALLLDPSKIGCAIGLSRNDQMC